MPQTHQTHFKLVDIQTKPFPDVGEKTTTTASNREANKYKLRNNVIPYVSVKPSGKKLFTMRTKLTKQKLSTPVNEAAMSAHMGKIHKSQQCRFESFIVQFHSHSHLDSRTRNIPHTGQGNNLQLDKRSQCPMGVMSI